MNELQHFLIVFDGASGTMKEDVRSFDDVGEALDAYAEAERRHGERVDREDRTVQVVLIAADSLETVMATHPNFWTSTDFRELTRAS